jgi:hypothetical protein
MNRLIHILVGWLALASLLVLIRSGEALRLQSPDRAVTTRDYVFLGLVIASVFFLQFAVERYLVPPDVFNKEQRTGLLQGAAARFRKSFFNGAIGLSYFFLICYVGSYLQKAPLPPEEKLNWIIYSVVFLIFGMLGKARGIILHLAGEKTAASLPGQIRS